MAAGGGTQQTLRRAIGALKDSTKVGLANLNSENKGLDVAIVKATKHNEVLPKEKHITTIFLALSAASPRADVARCIHGLIKRLTKTHNWTVALKTLIVLHRAMRDVDPTFREELIKYNRGRRFMMNLSYFRDESSTIAWDFSAWVRTYALYLEEHLECFSVLKYDIVKEHAKTKELDTPDLLEQLPAIQMLLDRLLACKPEAAAGRNNLIQYAVSLLAGESVKLYVAIADGILNLVDKYFEMQHRDATRALQIYKKAATQGDKLSEFYEICRGLSFGRGMKFVKIERPPQSFLIAMEEYVSDTKQNIIALPPPEEHIPDAVEFVDHKQDRNDQENASSSDASPDQAKSDKNEAAATACLPDLLGLDDWTDEPCEPDNKNSLALAIVSSDNPLECENRLDSTSQATSWELGLAATLASTEPAVVDSNKLGGGLDKLSLDSLYEQAMARPMPANGTYHMGPVSTNPFESPYSDQDPFNVSGSTALQHSGQMPIMCEHQALYSDQHLFNVSGNISPQQPDGQMPAMGEHQALYMVQQDHQQPQQEPLTDGNGSGNPFGNPFVNQTFPSQPPQSSYGSLI